MENMPLREVSSPLTSQMLAPLTGSHQWVQFSSLPEPDDLDRLAQLLERHPGVGLRAYGGYDGSIRDLEFLAHFPRLRRFQVDVFELASIDGLEHLPDDVDVLGIGQTRRRTQLRLLERFSHLRSLSLGHNVTGIDVLSTLTSLESLSLRSVTLDDLAVLVPLERLAALDLKLGGTRDLALLPRVGRIRYLELWMVRGLQDIGPIADLDHLEFLFLQSLAKVDRVPSLRASTNLQRVHLEAMKSLTDLRPVAQAPSLRELLVIDMPHLDPEDLACFVGHPSLRSAAIGLGSQRRNRAVQQLLGLPDPPPRPQPPFGLHDP